MATDVKGTLKIVAAGDFDADGLRLSYEDNLLVLTGDTLAIQAALKLWGKQVVLTEAAHV